MPSPTLENVHREKGPPPPVCLFARTYMQMNAYSVDFISKRREGGPNKKQEGL